MSEKNKLEQLKSMTTIVVDTGDIDAVKKYSPTDATTNPSLIYAAAQKSQYHGLIHEAIANAKKKTSHPAAYREAVMDWLFVIFGREILKLIPGRVSTEVDARLSFDVKGSIAKAKTLIALYESLGIKRDRILIKLASTWEGAKAAKVLEKEGIHVNMTLMFSLEQAIVCAKAGATLVSPFVGRILDWYKKSEGVAGYPAAQDPGVLSVTQIYNYYKKFGYKTQVMGASFRNSDEILELAGCDLLTISPNFLEELQNATGIVEQKLESATAKKAKIKKQTMTEPNFRLGLNKDAMATEKLAEGIRNFAKDAEKLEDYILKNF